MSSNERPKRQTTATRSSSTNHNSATTSSSLNNSIGRPFRSSRLKNPTSLIENDDSSSSDDETFSKKSNQSKLTNGRLFNATKTNGSTSSNSQSNNTSSFKIDIDKLAKLESITGLSRAEATQLLEASNNKLDVAVDLHFNGGSSSSSTSAIQNGISSNKTATSSNSLLNGHKSTTNGHTSNKRALANDDDSNSNSNMGDDYVRAPIPRKSEKLLDYDPHGKRFYFTLKK
jgi:hypothetical protein